MKPSHRREFDTLVLGERVSLAIGSENTPRFKRQHRKTNAKRRELFIWSRVMIARRLAFQKVLDKKGTL